MASKEPKQERSAKTLSRLTNAAICIIAREGLNALTHRRLAQVADCSLALTTYYFPKKVDMISSVSQDVLHGYLKSFSRAAEQYQAGHHPPDSLWSFAIRVICASAGRYRNRTAAWAEIYLDGIRHEASRQLVKTWMVELRHAWQRIANVIEPECCQKKIQSRIDLVTGLSFMALGLRLEPGQIYDVLERKIEPAFCWMPNTKDSAMGTVGVEKSRSNKAALTQQNILNGAVEILKEDGIAGVTHVRVAQKAGVTSSALYYHYPTISSLLTSAQTTFFEESKARYREALADVDSKKSSLDDLSDITGFILQREVMLFTTESLALYQFWLEAGRQDRILGILWTTIEDQAQAWERRLEALYAPITIHDAMLMQALFVGKLIRLLSSGGAISELASVRSEFALELQSILAGAFPDRGKN